MENQQLIHWMKHPEILNQETLYELRTLIARYPYFHSIRLLYLKNLFLLHDRSFGEELRKAAILVPDRKVLFDLIEGDHFIIRPQDRTHTIEEDISGDRTLSLINAFLSTQPEEEKPVSVSTNTATDYTAYLMQEQEMPVMEEPASLTTNEQLIDDFLTEMKDEKSLSQSLAEQEPEASLSADNKMEPVVSEEQVLENDDADGLDESYFTETLAKIYIKQGKYSQALKIIKKLNLNYPKKNSYFADQIRFLEKLIINAKTNK